MASNANQVFCIYVGMHMIARCLKCNVGECHIPRQPGSINQFGVQLLVLCVQTIWITCMELARLSAGETTELMISRRISDMK
jgi:hypothetical protein